MQPHQIPLHQPQLEYESLRTELDAAMQSAAAGGKYILGPETQQFEREFSDYVGTAHAVGVGNGSDALYLALQALEIEPGDEVITTPFTFFATSEAILRVGAKPVFVDIEPDGFNLDVKRIAQAITPSTRAILPVHLFGQPCQMAELREIAMRHQLHVVEDCAQATGASYRDPQTGESRKAGSLGDVACFSFFPTKNLGTLGDGGMVTTDNPEIYRRVEMLRRHGSTKKYHHGELGINSRLDELHAAMLRVKLPHLDAWNLRRRQLAEQYRALLSGSDAILLPQQTTTDDACENSMPHVFHQFTIRVDSRDEVQLQLRELGIHTAIYYPLPLHLQQVHSDLRLGKGAFPQAERAAATCLSLPMHPHLSTDDVNRVAMCVLNVVAQSVTSQNAPQDQACYANLAS